MPARHLAIVLLICIAWAGNFLTSAAALQEIPPFLFTALRLAILAVLLVPFLRAPASGQWSRLVAVCLLNGVFHFGLSFWALKLAGNLASPAIVMQSYVPMATILAVVFLRERIGWRTSAGIAVSFLGVLVLGFDPVVLAAPASLILMLIAALFLAAGTVVMRGLRDMTLFTLQGWTAVLGVLPLLALSWGFEADQVEALREATWIGWGGAAYSAIAASLLGHGLYYWLVQRHPVSTVTPYLLIAPVLAIILGVLFWGDRPGPRLLLGGAMVLSGVLAIALRARSKSRKPPDAACT